MIRCELGVTRTTQVSYVHPLPLDTTKTRCMIWMVMIGIREIDMRHIRLVMRYPATGTWYVLRGGRPRMLPLRSVASAVRLARALDGWEHSEEIVDSATARLAEYWRRPE